jgi:hypothetical protein
MTAGDLQTLSATLAEDIQQVQGTTEQVLLRGLVAAAETFNLTHGQERLTAKLRNMDPALRAQLLTKEQA